MIMETVAATQFCRYHRVIAIRARHYSLRGGLAEQNRRQTPGCRVAGAAGAVIRKADYLNSDFLPASSSKRCGGGALALSAVVPAHRWVAHAYDR
jgi:hypothetical protein